MGLLDRLLKPRVSRVRVVEETSAQAFMNAYAVVRTLTSEERFPEVLGTDADALKPAGWKLVMELVAFTLHLADRIAFGTLGPDQRNRFIDALLQSVSANLAHSLLKDAPPREEAEFRRDFLAICNDVTDFCAPLAKPGGAGAPLQGTLFWEAAKRTSSRIFASDPKATMFLSIAFGHCVDPLSGLAGKLRRMDD